MSTQRATGKAPAGPPSAVRRLARSNAAFLRQGVELIDRLDDERFRAAPQLDARLATAAALFRRGAVGAHFRHVLDHYVSFFAGLDGAPVDYDRRSRERDLERDRARCARRLEACIAHLEELARDGRDEPLETVLGGDAPDLPRAQGSSSVARELQFLASHTVHHYAIIAVIVRLYGIEPGDEFGVAPSTLEFERGDVPCAR